MSDADKDLDCPTDSGKPGWMYELAEVRAALTKEKERRESEDQTMLRLLNAERQRAEKAEAEIDKWKQATADAEGIGRAEVERLKASCALKHSDFGKLEMGWAHARATLAEREAEIERLRAAYKLADNDIVRIAREREHLRAALTKAQDACRTFLFRHGIHTKSADCLECAPFRRALAGTNG